MLKKAIIQRVYLKIITIGVLSVEGTFLCFTFELPWLNNQRRSSCIPEGVFMFSLIKGHKRFGDCYFCQTEIENRSEIFMHSANKLGDIKGCIAPVMTLLGDFGGEHSRLALNKIIEKLGHRFELEIKPYASPLQII